MNRLTILAALAVAIGLTAYLIGKPAPEPVAPGPAAPAADVPREEPVEPAPPPAHAAPAGPNVGGQVMDGRGAAVPNTRVRAVGDDGRILAETTTGEDGGFGMAVDASPPFSLRAGGDEGAESRVPVLPSLDHVLVLAGEKPGRDRLMVEVTFTEPVEDGPAEIRLLNDLGEKEASLRIARRPDVYTVEFVPFGTYDVLVDARGYSGRVEGFRFRPDARAVRVEVGPAAAVRGRTTLPASVRLSLEGEGFQTVAREVREDDAAAGRTRRLAAEAEEPVSEFSFSGLPPGACRLTLTGRGVETTELLLTLAPGQDLDLGTIDLVPAEGRLDVVLFDREDDRRNLEHGYRVTLYSLRGVRRWVRMEPGPKRAVTFEGLSGDRYRLRVERVIDEGHTQRYGPDRTIDLEAGATRRVVVDQTWRL